MSTSRFTAEEGSEHQRLDVFLSDKLGEAVSRSRVRDLIAGGHVAVEGTAAAKANRRLKAGEVVVLTMPEPEPARPAAQPIALSVAFEDEHMIVVDKPAGLVVHPGAGRDDGTLVNALLAHCGDSLSGIGGVARPGIVHRLDKETSGLLVVAKTDLAHRGLSEQFAAHGRDGRLERAYLAFVWGEPPRAKGTVEAPLGRDGTNRLKRAVVPAGRSDARAAVTHYRRLGRFPAATGAGGEKGVETEATVSALACRLETGRTHQIRVHLAHLGHPLLGDALYGAGFRTKAARLAEDRRGPVEALGRQALHAALLGFVHPATGEPLALRSALPDDLAGLARTLDLDPGRLVAAL